MAQYCQGLGCLWKTSFDFSFNGSSLSLEICTQKTSSPPLGTGAWVGPSGGLTVEPLGPGVGVTLPPVMTPCKQPKSVKRQ